MFYWCASRPLTFSWVNKNNELEPDLKTFPVLSIGFQFTLNMSLMHNKSLSWSFEIFNILHSQSRPSTIFLSITNKQSSRISYWFPIHNHSSTHTRHFVMLRSWIFSVYFISHPVRTVPHSAIILLNSSYSASSFFALSYCNKISLGRDLINMNMRMMWLYRSQMFVWNLIFFGCACDLVGLIWKWNGFSKIQTE